MSRPLCSVRPTSIAVSTLSDATGARTIVVLIGVVVWGSDWCHELVSRMLQLRDWD